MMHTYGKSFVVFTGTNRHERRKAGKIARLSRRDHPGSQWMVDRRVMMRKRVAGWR